MKEHFKKYLAYVLDMKYYIVLNKLGRFPNNNSARYPKCPGMPGIREKRAKNKQAKQSRKTNRR